MGEWLGGAKISSASSSEEMSSTQFKRVRTNISCTSADGFTIFN